MTFRKLGGVTRLLDGKSSRTIASLKVFEPVDRDTTKFQGCAKIRASTLFENESLRGARRKLQETRFALRWPAADAFPEPLYYLVVHLIATIVRELGPIIAVNQSNV
jgi:hypothetical protein